MSETLRVREAILADREGRTLLDVFMATCDVNGGRGALVAKEDGPLRARCGGWSSV